MKGKLIFLITALIQRVDLILFGVFLLRNSLVIISSGWLKFAVIMALIHINHGHYKHQRSLFDCFNVDAS